MTLIQSFDYLMLIIIIGISLIGLAILINKNKR